MSFLSMIENLEVTPGDPSAKVVVNSRTGTVVISRNVKVTNGRAVTHGPITVRISATNEVSQANPFADGGQTVAIQNADVAIEEPVKPMFLFQPGVDLRDRGCGQPGRCDSVFPIAILEALKSSGSAAGRASGYLMNTGNLDTYFDFKGLGELKAQSNGTKKDEAVTVAKQFEAYFIGEMLKSMRLASESFKSDLIDSRSMDTYQEMFDQQISVSLSERGALGLQDVLERAMDRMSPRSASDISGLGVNFSN